MMSSAFCPDCDEKITMNPRARLGQRLNCPHCDAELEVIGVNPLEFDWAYDWSWDDGDAEEEEEEEEEEEYD